MKKKLEDSKKMNMFRDVSSASAIRVRVLYICLGILQSVQLVIYLLEKESMLHNYALMYLKAIIIIFIMIYLPLLNRMVKKKGFFYENSEVIIAIMMMMTLCWSVVNTFIAQTITSDISVYVLVLFSATAVVRVRPRYFVTIYVVVYIFFVTGMPYFQFEPHYLGSHIINGFILNLVAILISNLFYKNEKDDYMSKEALKEKNRELLFLSQHDGLTTLYNHKTIHELLGIAIIKGEEADGGLYLMLLDLDNFKDVNDTYGHKSGDEVLKKVAISIKTTLMEQGTAGRYGGDEFMIIMADSSYSNVMDKGYKILEEVSKIKVNKISLTFSAGIVRWKGESVDRFVEKADLKMYQSKRDGRNQIGI